MAFQRKNQRCRGSWRAGRPLGEGRKRFPDPAEKFLDPGPLANPCAVAGVDLIDAPFWPVVLEVAEFQEIVPVVEDR